GRELRAAARRLAREGDAPFFAFESHFGDVVAGGGFDLVVGNPPWVRGERLPARVRETLAHRYASWRPSAGRGFSHLPDLAVAFVERGLVLGAPGGCGACPSARCRPRGPGCSTPTPRELPAGCAPRSPRWASGGRRSSV